MLKYMHEQDDDSNDDGEEMVPLILPITIFEHHEEIRDYRY